MEPKPSTEAQQPSRPMRLAEAAAFTGFSPKYLYNLVNTRQIPFYKPRGGRIYFKQEELEEFIFRGRVSADYELKGKAEQIMTKGKE